MFKTMRVTFPKESNCFFLTHHLAKTDGFFRHKKWWLFRVFLLFLNSMLRAQMQDSVIPREKPRRSVSLRLPYLVDVNGFSRKSSSYSKLPEEPIKLSVRKLDGSSFDVDVIKSATISDLKLAVQDVFSHMPKKGPGKISWPHVWGHFCLCYDGYKLLTDTDHIMNYGIKDGDQLHFIRHVSSSYNLTKIQPKGRTDSRKQSYLSVSSSTSTLPDEEGDDYTEDRRCKTRNDKKQSTIVNQECQFGQLWRGRSSHSRMSSIGRKGSSKGRVCRAGNGPSFVGNCRKIFQLWCTAKYSPKRK